MLNRRYAERCVCLVVLVLLISTTGHTHAQGEHSRRAAAELTVLVGDVVQLKNRVIEDTEPHLQRGLADRIRASLSSLDIVLRLADQESQRPQRRYTPEVRQAVEYLEQGNATSLASLEMLLSDLVARFPLVEPTFPESQVLLSSVKQLHQELCAACHDHPATGAERPAYNLAQQAKTTSDIEFYARMLVGVRGDRVTGIDNPLSDMQIAGLLYYYRSQ
ncbi:MAG: hypothetical protein KTR32_22390 [Granulosicoccus sp.]|nr:hypothetical protein [Granulosicoccus sp.]